MLFRSAVLGSYSTLDFTSARYKKDPLLSAAAQGGQEKLQSRGCSKRLADWCPYGNQPMFTLVIKLEENLSFLEKRFFNEKEFLSS